MKEATWAGAKAAAIATVISGGVIMAGVHFLPRFGKALGTSARTALIVRGRKGPSMLWMLRTECLGKALGRGLCGGDER